MSEHTCGACTWWARLDDPEEPWLGICCARTLSNTYENRRACPAFASRSAAANQAKLIEAVKGLMEAARGATSKYGTMLAGDVFDFGPLMAMVSKALAAVEEAMKEVEK